MTTTLVKVEVVARFKYKEMEDKKDIISIAGDVNEVETALNAGREDIQETIENHVFNHMVTYESNAEINHADYSESKITFKATINGVSVEEDELLTNHYDEDELQDKDESEVESDLEYDLLEKVKEMVVYEAQVYKMNN